MPRQFIAPDESFTLMLPDEWDEYELEDEENTFGFFNSASENWMGNFRLTPHKLGGGTEPPEGRAGNLIAGELEENKSAVKVKLGNYDAAHYKESYDEDGQEYTIYYWVAGRKDDFFMCSFTINKEQEGTAENQTELETVQNIIASIQPS